MNNSNKMRVLISPPTIPLNAIASNWTRFSHKSNYSVFFCTSDALCCYYCVYPSPLIHAINMCAVEFAKRSFSKWFMVCCSVLFHVCSVLSQLAWQSNSHFIWISLQINWNQIGLNCFWISENVARSRWRRSFSSISEPKAYAILVLHCSDYHQTWLGCLLITKRRAQPITHVPMGWNTMLYLRSVGEIFSYEWISIKEQNQIKHRKRLIYLLREWFTWLFVNIDLFLGTANTHKLLIA